MSKSSDLRCKYISSRNLENILKQDIRVTPTSFFNDENEFYCDNNSDYEIYDFIVTEFAKTIASRIPDDEKLRASCAAYHFFDMGRFFGKFSGCHPSDLDLRDGVDYINYLFGIINSGYSPKEAVLLTIKECGVSVKSIAKKYVDACIGVLCMTSRPDNESAWKTYAGDSTGLCIVFKDNFFVQAHTEAEVQYISNGEIRKPSVVKVRDSAGIHFGSADPLGEIMSSGLPADFLWRFYCKEKVGYDQYYDKDKRNLLDWSSEEEIRYLTDIREYDYLSGKPLDNIHKKDVRFIDISGTRQPLKVADVDGFSSRYIIAGENASNLTIFSIFVATISGGTTFINTTPVLRVNESGNVKYLCGSGRILKDQDYPTCKTKPKQSQYRYLDIEIDDPSLITYNNMKTIFLTCLLCGSFAAEGNSDLMFLVMSAMMRKIIVTNNYLIKNSAGKSDFDIQRLCRKVLGIGFHSSTSQHDKKWLNGLGVKGSGLSILSYSKKCSGFLRELFGIRFSEIDMRSFVEEIYNIELKNGLTGIIPDHEAIFFGGRDSNKSNEYAI